MTTHASIRGHIKLEHDEKNYASGDSAVVERGFIAGELCYLTKASTRVSTVNKHVWVMVTLVCAIVQSEM